jgi:hypothetical protein
MFTPPFVASAPGAIIGAAAKLSELSKVNPATRPAANSTLCNVFIVRLSSSKYELSNLRLESVGMTNISKLEGPADSQLVRAIMTARLVRTGECIRRCGEEKIGADEINGGFERPLTASISIG